MELKFNYERVYFFLLSLFGIILVLSLMGQINSNLAREYSIFGIAVCIAAWIIDGQIMHKAEEPRSYGLPDLNDLDVHKMLGHRIILMWILFGVLLLSLLFFARIL